MSQYDSPISTEPGDDLYAADDAGSPRRDQQRLRRP